ncbi:MAG: TraR/DksA family transcriptional regulator [Cytophagales bacterium]|nr:TraR/DksA family transcriptional regulator [Cytophagales bacterium]
MEAMTEKTRYTDSELIEFEQIILEKLAVAEDDLQQYKDYISNRTNNNRGYSEDDSAELEEREMLTQLAARQSKHIGYLKNALIRIKNGTYGVCFKTGKLISKERLKLVPHTTLSIEAKRQQQ